MSKYYTPEVIREARLKQQRDAAGRLEYACFEGYMQGVKLRLDAEFAAAEKLGREICGNIGRIDLLEQILELPRTSVDKLFQLSLEELRARVDQLNCQLQNRTPES